MRARYRCPAVSRRFALAVLVVLILSAGAAAETLPQALQERSRSDPDREALVSLDFVLTLGLSREQARALLPIHAEACRLHTAAYMDRAEIQPEEIAAYTEFLAEDRLNRGFSPAVEQRTQRIHGRAIRTREAFAEDLNALADEVRSLLTPGQQQLADNYTPRNRALFAAFATPKDRRRLAKQQRSARKEQFKAGRRAVQRGQAPPWPVVDDPPLVQAREELEALHKAVHPRPEALAKYLLTPAAAETLYGLAGAAMPAEMRDAVRVWRYGVSAYPLAKSQQDEAHLQALRKEINNWNLVNGMHFERAQIERLVYLAGERERVRAAERQADPRHRPSPAAINATMVKIELAAESTLNPGQREVLKTYKSCLIPPKNLKDPVRVGQASDATRMAAWLERARERSGAALERLVTRQVEGESTHLGPLDSAQRAQREALLRRTAEEAAEMSDVEFALNKDELAERIQPEDRKETLTAEINAMRRARLQPGRTTQLLLNADFARVLMERYAQLSRPSGLPKADLANGPQAPDCEKNCAARRAPAE